MERLKVGLKENEFFGKNEESILQFLSDSNCEGLIICNCLKALPDYIKIVNDPEDFYLVFEKKQNSIILAIADGPYAEAIKEDFLQKKENEDKAILIDIFLTEIFVSSVENILKGFEDKKDNQNLLQRIKNARYGSFEFFLGSNR